MISSSQTFLYIISLSSIIIGLCICFFGYRLFRLIIAITGFIVGAILSIYIGIWFIEEQGSPILLVFATIGGLLGALIFLFLYSAGLFLFGAFSGIILCSSSLSLINIELGSFPYIICALVGGFIALLLKKFTVILTTSYIGALLAVLALYFLLIQDISLDFINSMHESAKFRLVLGWIALGTLGFIVQYLFFSKKVQSNQIIDISKDD